MALKIIVSYDDTDNDRDALALGRLLALSGAELSLAYVRHSFGESLEQKQAEELLDRGAASVGAPDMPRRVVVNPNTSVGLTELAEEEGADVVVFGSEYRTANGTLKPGISAHKMLLGGPAAIAVAPAGLRSNPSVSVNTIGVVDEGDGAARATAESLAATLGGSVKPGAEGPLDLLVVGSRPEAPQGKVVLSAASDYAVEAATYPVIVVPRGVTVRFDSGPSAEPQAPSAPAVSA
jgi:nucleotide-binding universal stress UspA family protein